MEKVRIGRLKFVISNMPNLKGCNITLPEGVTTAFISEETLEMLLKKVRGE